MNNSETCGDCGTLLQGNFCHNCGPYWITRSAREPVFYSENDETHKLSLVSGFFAPSLT